MLLNLLHSWRTAGEPRRKRLAQAPGGVIRMTWKSIEEWLNDHCVTIAGEFCLLIPGVFDLLAPDEEKLPPGIYHLKWDQLKWD